MRYTKTALTILLPNVLDNQDFESGNGYWKTVLKWGLRSRF
jgi:hypothetical protein